jgi:hypothetical protein
MLFKIPDQVGDDGVLAPDVDFVAAAGVEAFAGGHVRALVGKVYGHGVKGYGY